MSATPRFISDLHLDHKKILHFSGAYRQGSTTAEHDEWIIAQWNSVVRKRDPVFILGDIAFTQEGLERIKELRGQKFLLLGNHDKFTIPQYESVGLTVIGFKMYKGFWLSHAPVHPQELRGYKNIHGHVHARTINDDRYINVSVEAINGQPLSIHDIEAREVRSTSKQPNVTANISVDASGQIMATS